MPKTIDENPNGGLDGASLLAFSYLVAHSMGIGGFLADDMAQEAAVAALEKYGGGTKFDPTKASLKTWLEGRMRGAIIDYFRTRHAQVRVPRSMHQKGTPSAEYTSLDDAGFNLAYYNPKAEQQATIKHIIWLFENNYRGRDREQLLHILRLYFEGYLLSEIAKLFRVTESRMSQRLTVATKWLKEFLDRRDSNTRETMRAKPKHRERPPEKEPVVVAPDPPKAIPTKLDVPPELADCLSLWH